MKYVRKNKSIKLNRQKKEDNRKPFILVKIYNFESSCV